MTLSKGRKIALEARVDPRSLATIATAFSKNNIPIASRSQLISLAVETFCDSLVSSNVVPWIESTAEALQVLSGVGIRFTEMSKRNLRAIALQINSERSLEGIGASQVDAVPELTPELIDEALLKFKDSEAVIDDVP